MFLEPMGAGAVRAVLKTSVATASDRADAHLFQSVGTDLH